MSFEAVGPLRTLLRAGAGADNVTLSHLRFTGSHHAYLDPHGAPAGGDFALQRSAAVEVSGATGVGVHDCTFTRLDGHGLLLSGYTRGTTVLRNTFEWIGDSAIVSWGDTDGIDGTGGRQPRGTVVDSNLIHDIGVYSSTNVADRSAPTHAHFSPAPADLPSPPRPPFSLPPSPSQPALPPSSTFPCC